MPDRSQASSSRDFAFQTSDQAAQQLYGHYDAEHETAASGATDQDASLRYQAFGVQPPQPQYPGYNFSPSAPLGWDWTNSIDFSDFTAQYEPQGELVQELQHPHTANDFSIPLPIAIDSGYQAPQHSQVTTPVPANTQNPLSPPPKPPQRPVVQTGMKRKAESEPSSAVSHSTSGAADAQQNQSKRQNKSRQSSATSLTSPVVAEPADARQSPMAPSAIAKPAPEPTTPANSELQRKKEASKGTGPQGRVIDVSTPRKVAESSGRPDMLPAGKVFPIQIGSELFRLSGASISSDGPSYFSHFFGEQLHNNGGRAGDVRTLYIDRDPDTFRDIALHLQGYHITPKNGEQFVKLFADAQFYSLSRLTKQLFNTDIFIRIGGTPFQIPRDLFSSPGDSPNYFSLGFAQFFSSPSEAFPGLDRSALLRPPSISPPSAPNKSGETFAELIRILQGYKVEIRNDEHRSQLLRDARYFHLKGLEQRLIPCEISHNLKRQQSEILIRLEDIRQSGVSFSADKEPTDSDSNSQSSTHGASPSASKAASPAPSLTSVSPSIRPGFVSYARPYTNDHARTNILVLEVSSRETTTLYLPLSAPQSSSSSPTLSLRAIFHDTTLARITSLFSVVASKMGLPATQPLGLMYLQTGSGVAAQPVSPANSGVSERRVRVRLDTDCALEIDGAPAELRIDDQSGRIGIQRSTDTHSQLDRQWLWGGGKTDTEMLRTDDDEVEAEWIVKRAHWRLRVEPVEYEGERRMQVVLCGVKIEAFTVERRRNVERGFLGSA
ncbi:hypothetical protein CC86DRAFT_201972 [Ophiobolus disseminans]|uniref:BTB/POZ domain-containing protein n=1 Tax=Ophiobolus disseminans TaxID=1469910 RepID=A0A6A7A3Q5_9PLEO|nr:hypothetical protein CC86DRAFT_201972 [Ophiobolus disseminans]